MMGAILKQLVGRVDIPKNVREALQEGKKEIGGRGLRLAGLMGMLRIAIASLPKVFICIDALGECLPRKLPELLESLRDIIRESPKAKIFLTGRPHVKEAIQRYFGNAIVIPISPNPDNIRNYLENDAASGICFLLLREARNVGVTENVKILALRLFARFDEHISAQLLLLRYNRDIDSAPHFYWKKGPIGFTGLHGAVFYGIVEIVAVVLEMKE